MLNGLTTLAVIESTNDVVTLSFKKARVLESKSSKLKNIADERLAKAAAEYSR